MKNIFIIFQVILMQGILIYPFIAPINANATEWCMKPVERSTHAPVSEMSFASTTMAASMFVAQTIDAGSVRCAVDLRIYTSTSAACSGNFQASIYANTTNYAGSGLDGPTGAALATSSLTDCNGFTNAGSTFYSFTLYGNLDVRRFSFTPQSNGQGTSTFPALTPGTKYWLVVTSFGGTGTNNVRWGTSTTQTSGGGAGTGRIRTGNSIGALTTTTQTNYGSFKFYTPFNDPNRSGVFWDNSYHCDDWDTSMGEPKCSDTDTSLYFASTNPCSITDNGHAAETNPTVPATDYSFDGPYETITAASNYPGGGGGKGQRHTLGIIKCYPQYKNPCGSNANASGGANDWFPYPGIRDGWYRNYVRFENGWTWGGLAMFKIFYPSFYLKKPECISNSVHGCLMGDHIDMPDGSCTHNCQHGNNTGCDGTLSCQNGTGLGWGMIAAEGDQIERGCQACGWVDMYNTGISDGSWHEIEMHIRVNDRCGDRQDGTPAIPCNGIFQAWVDGRMVNNETNRDYGNPVKKHISPFNIIDKTCTVGCNPDHPDEYPEMVGLGLNKIGANGNLYNDYNIAACHYIDYDDFKISTDGYVGQIGSGIPLASGKVTNVHVE